MFINFLLITFLIAMVLRLVLPALLRWALSAFVKRQMRKGGVVFGPNGNPFAAPSTSSGPSRAADGEVRVDYVPPTAKRQPDTNFRGGDYVDFEEVK
ncbi:DUF4834 family protein [Solirubrum puertoriconensis]|uniref:DUF4834 domain-containing protein n=1 Tax=Solirubrum puertoriconensis TaxID=1751427 RepID=A0A9X0HI08_SOLP1|nr:hypothetical protein [Solirubrum puertoriconensis]KUG06243.1 hypothetical protein ASU33_02450 [Solirubrum puertoriconensis]